MKKEVVIALGGIVLCCAFSLQTPAATTTAEQAKALVEKYVPAESIYLRTEDDKGRFEVKYYSKDRSEKYEIEVSKTPQKIISFSSELYNNEGSQTITLTEKDAEKIVSAEIADAQILSLSLDQDDGLNEYEVKFQTKTYYGSYNINPQNGIVLKRDIHLGSLPSKNDKTVMISYEDALKLALTQVPDALITDVDFEREGSLSLYIIELYKDGYEYDLAFDGKTGKLLWNSNHKDNGWYAPISQKGSANTSKNTSKPAASQANTFIGLEKAKEIAIENAPTTAILVKCQLDYDDGKAVYEGELRNGNWEYEFEIDAVSGLILEWDADND